MGIHGSCTLYSLGSCKSNDMDVYIPNLVFNFLKYYRRPVRLSVRPSICLSVRLSQKMSQNQPKGSNNRLAKARGRRPDALPAGLVGLSAGRRLQKLSSAPRAFARLQYTYCICTYNMV